jgi:hypothetical protein
MSKRDCLEADWYRVGYEVGFDGNRELVEAYDKRVDICSEYGVQAQFAEFEAGHMEGIEKYCEPGNAVRVGARGDSNPITNNVCPEYDYPGFDAAYNAGYKLYQLRLQESQAQNEIEQLENQIYRNSRQINNLRRTLNSDQATEQQQREAQRRIRYLYRDSRSLDYDIDRYRREYRRLKEAADTYANYLELEYGEL